MRLKPVNDKIVVKPIKKEDDHITEGGIILSADVDDNKPGSAPALVINVGPEVTGIAPNDVIYVDWSKGLIVDVDEERQGVILPLEAVKAIK